MDKQKNKQTEAEIGLESEVITAQIVKQTDIKSGQMTKVSPEFGDQMQMEAVMSVSVDVSFASNRFPKYRIGADNQILDEAKEDPKGPPLKEVVTQETAQLVEQQKRLSVRDLASKFDKNLAAAAKLSDEAKLREVASLEGHVLLKKLRDALESLRGRLAGRNKEDVEKAISMVEALAVKLTQKEGELIQEKFEVKKLANFLKQASEDAKKLVNQERSFACAEIESARAVVQRFGEALEEEERISQTSGKQELDELLEEVQEARRIKLLHQPSKLAMSRRAEENKFRVYELGGSETLGSALRVQPCSDEAQDLSKCSIQWYRIPTEGSRRELISGANKSIYAPEPFDVGRFWKLMLSQLVVISQMNGQNYSSRSVHLFHVGKMRMKLCKGWITKARESYSTSMQLCGFRGGGNSAAKSLFWQARKGQSFVLVFESERERNAAVMLARKIRS
ncbi:Stomatal closure-related actin-binding protein 1 [Camellia lanceoleosa]|uniref:Stomatal closure-related actin-binding protein 1 n=1 Tax=Camellia lanceoleosa TaxID=1840588 RepID=A0ACC0FV83_9ERIC|nr:Stomatal closure-related actin-binding protein 1 [Camellia lanceoleosa]